MSRTQRYVVTVALSDNHRKNFAPKRNVEPELNLMAAILEEGLRCFRNNILRRTAREKKLFEEAQAWILAEESHESHGCCSFESVCMALDIEPRVLRKRIMAWKAAEDHREQRI